MKYKFFKVTEGPMVERLKEIKAIREETSKKLDELVSFYGAKEVLTFTGGAIAAFVFDCKPDLSVWKRAKHGWLPKVSTKQGKVIKNKINECGERPPFNDALKVYGINNMMIFGEPTGNGIPMCKAGLVGSFNDCVFFLKVPSPDSEPFESKFDTMVEVKEWEMLKHID